MRKYTIEEIKHRIVPVVKEFPVSRVTLFGSVANGTATEGSDVDLIVEFSSDISLLTLSQLKYRLEDVLFCPVDVIHGPLRETDMIEIDKVVDLYAA